MKRRSSKPTWQLTRSEWAIAEQLALGLSNKEIADALGKGMGTVKNQVGSLLEKTGTKSRLQLVVTLLREGRSPSSLRVPALRRTALKDMWAPEIPPIRAVS